jgi:hypothetical protein
MSDNVGAEGNSEGSAQEYLASLEAEVGNTRQEAQQARRESAQLAQTVGKIREAFVPNEPARGDEWYDDFIDAMLEAEKAGKPMPLTGKLGTVLAQVQKERNQDKAQLAQLMEIVKQLKNPSNVADQRAFANMDDQIITTLEDMYGEDVPPAFAEAVSSEILSILDVIQREAPEKWKKIARSESMQRKLVLHCSQKLVPPKARETMISQYESQRPTTTQDFEQGWNEIAQLEELARRGEVDPREVGRLKTELRQQWLEYKFNGPSKYNKGRNR